jgi:hypothetical protein
MRSIRSYEAGLSIMGDTVPQRCIRCSAMSTGRWWHGPCGSTNALLVTGHGQASSSRPSQRRPRISSRTGGKKLSARSPDGSRVRRESHARFCERPEVDPGRSGDHPAAPLSWPTASGPEWSMREQGLRWQYFRRVAFRSPLRIHCSLCSPGPMHPVWRQANCPAIRAVSATAFTLASRCQVQVKA